MVLLRGIPSARNDGSKFRGRHHYRDKLLGYRPPNRPAITHMDTDCPPLSRPYLPGVGRSRFGPAFGDKWRWFATVAFHEAEERPMKIIERTLPPPSYDPVDMCCQILRRHRRDRLLSLVGTTGKDQIDGGSHQGNQLLTKQSQATSRARGDR